MIEEAYCSKEVAKLLKEKGFHIPVLSHYTKVGSVWHCDDREDFNKETEIECYSRPTHQLAMRWLREVHDRYIEIATDSPYNFGKGHVFRYCICDENVHLLHEEDNFKTYEEAVEAAIKYCLTNLI